MKSIIPFFFLLLFWSQLLGQYQLEILDCSAIDNSECLTVSDLDFQVDLSCFCSSSCGLLLPSDDFTTCSGRSSYLAYMIPFVATGNSVTVDLSILDTFNCSYGIKGMEIGIMGSCVSTCLEGDSNCGSPFDPISFTYDELDVGSNYVVFIDHCGHNGPIFEFSMSVSDNPEPAQDVIDYSFISSTGCESPLCLGSNITVLFETEIDGFLSNNREVYIDISGPTNYSIVKENIDDALILNNQDYNLVEGTYEICVTKVVTECVEIFVNDCDYFTIVDYQNEAILLDVCSSELEDGFGEDFLGYNVDMAGSYISEIETCECGDQVVVINELKIEEEEILIELCPDDHPFIFFGEYVFDYTDFIDEMYLELEEGSVQQDYNGNFCDSLVRLQFEVLNCGYCTYPSSLDNANLLLCIPFLEGAQDFSPYKNEVISYGVNYEDFSLPDVQDLKGNFDGQNDYVLIPKGPHFNESIFSFSIEFEKYDVFDNSQVETIVSMGSDDNLRFNVDLIETSMNSFDLQASFYTQTDELIIAASDLQINTEYDVVFVVNENTIILYVDGENRMEINIPSPLNLDDNFLVLGAKSSGITNTQFYNGYINDFKYWAEELMEEDVTLLHSALAQFTVTNNVPLSCCQELIVNGEVLNIDNPIVTVVLPGASVTGYDSTYVYNFIAVDPAPVVIASLVPEDILVNYQKECDELCAQMVSWDVNPQDVFTDNCQNLRFEQSHFSPLMMDENNPEVEVVYTAIDICDNRSEFSFIIELNCIASQESSIEEDNSIVVQLNDACMDDQNAICINANVEILPTFIDADSNVYNYNETDHPGLEYSFSVNGQSQNFSFENGTAFKPNFIGAGAYEICLETISDDCVTKFVNVCETINIYESQSIDYGTYEACSGDHISVVPMSVSTELRSVIDNDQNVYSASSADACGCTYSEVITINNVSNGLAESVVLELCEDDFVIILGQSFSYSDSYERELITFENSSIHTNSLGEKCDSLIELTIVQLETPSEEQIVSICEGEVYDGYSQSGNYQIVLNSAAENGCDSMLTLSLSVIPTSYTELIEVICPNDIFMGYDTTGLYEVLLIGEDGCDSIVTIDLTVLEAEDPLCISTSVGELEKSDLTIYPNPTSGYLFMKSNLENSESLSEIIIYSYDGNEVLSDSYREEKGIDVSQLIPGLYIIKVSSGKNEMWSKFIKS